MIFWNWNHPSYAARNKRESEQFICPQTWNIVSLWHMTHDRGASDFFFGAGPSIILTEIDLKIVHWPFLCYFSTLDGRSR